MSLQPSLTTLLLPLPLIILLLLLTTPSAASQTALSFCKCSCGLNSTIIPLPATSSCNDCNRSFCLDYHLPICKGVKEEEVVTICFQRDSVKDQIVVCVFIVATVGLLLWALVRPYVTAWLERARHGMRGYEGLRGGEGR